MLSLDISSFKPTNQIIIKVPKVCVPTNKITWVLIFVWEKKQYSLNFYEKNVMCLTYHQKIAFCCISGLDSSPLTLYTVNANGTLRFVEKLCLLPGMLGTFGCVLHYSLCFIITYSYSMAFWNWGFLLTFDWFVHFVECPNV